MKPTRKASGRERAMEGLWMRPFLLALMPCFSMGEMAEDEGGGGADILQVDMAAQTCALCALPAKPASFSFAQCEEQGGGGFRTAWFTQIGKVSGMLAYEE